MQERGFHQDRETDPSGEDGHASLTRRDLLAGTAATFALLLCPAGAVAEVDGPQTVMDFFFLSRAATGRMELSPVTANRIYQALSDSDEKFSGDTVELVRLAETAKNPEELQRAAATVGLDAALMAIVTAWYTGTVVTSAGTVVVTYHDALMYRPVADGLTVPTYCSNGPLWWTGLPPEVTRSPINFPKVL